MPLSPLRKGDQWFYSWRYTVMRHVGKVPSRRWRTAFAPEYICLPALTLIPPHNATYLGEMGARPSQRQCIIPTILAGSAVKDDIRSARGQPVFEPSDDSPLGSAALTFILFCRSCGTELLRRAGVQSALLQGFTTQVKLDGVRAFSSI